MHRHTKNTQKSGQALVLTNMHLLTDIPPWPLFHSLILNWFMHFGFWWAWGQPCNSHWPNDSDFNTTFRTESWKWILFNKTDCQSFSRQYTWSVTLCLGTTSVWCLSYWATTCMIYWGIPISEGFPSTSPGSLHNSCVQVSLMLGLKFVSLTGKINFAECLFLFWELSHS